MTEQYIFGTPDEVEAMMDEARLTVAETLDALVKRNEELMDIFQAIQPLLYNLSVTLYGDDAATIPLSKLIEDGVQLLKPKEEADAAH